MNTAVISSLPEKHNFDSAVKEVSGSANETKLNDKIVKNVTKEEPPALHVLSESSAKTSSANTVCVSSTNVKPSTRVVPVMYIQAPANLKVPASITTTVTVATPTGPKQTYAYLGTIIKPAGAKTSENQIVVPTSHLPAGLVPAPTNQKLVLTSMPKLTPRVPITCSTSSNPQTKISSLILPLSSSQLKNASQNVINFKISNGQFQSDPKGCISVLSDGNLAENNNEPSKEPTDSKIKPLTEKVYELSIPDVTTSKFAAEPKKVDDIFGNQYVGPKHELQIPRKSLHEVSILKNRKSDLSSKKVEPKIESSTEVKSEPVAEGEVKTEEKQPEIRKINPERRRKSQYTYLRDFDEVIVTSGNAWDDSDSNNKVKKFQSSEITFTKLPIKEELIDNKKSVDDFIEIEVVKEQLPQFNSEDDQDIKTVLKWRDGIGFLPGSKLKFHINEFGIIEMLVEEELEKLKIKKEENETKNEILRCNECGCHGLPTEFISNNYCSKECKLTVLKNAKAKRKKKKLAMIQKHKSDDNISNKTEENSQNQMNPASDEENSNDIFPTQNYPWQKGKKGFSWAKYLEHIKKKAAPTKLFKDPFPYAKNGFRPGMKLEGIDPQHPSYFCVMTVSEVQGYRIRLHFDGYPDNFDFWINADSMNIFPIGWCEKFNHVLHPPPPYSVSEFNWTSYLKNCKATAAPRHLFAHRAGSTVCPNGFRLGMKLEAVDRKNTSLICVASVTDLMDNRFLVHFDSWDDIYDYWADPTSPYIHPVGWCDEFGHNLTPPNDYPDPENFTWEKYLRETKSVAAPVRAFKQRPSTGFKKDMRLETVDRRVPQLIRVSSVEEVRDHQIKIRFDGWPSKYSFWIDDDSPDIHPAGWCQKTGHPLESPLTPEEVYETYSCPTVGCRGVGHIQGPKHSTHTTSKDCPYSDENLDSEFVLPDRLTLTNKDFIQEAVVPVEIEPREIRKPNRPKKIRRLTETSSKPEWSTEDDLSDSSRKRKMSASRETISSPLLKLPEENRRFKSIGGAVEFTSSCPSQQVLAKHSQILHELIGNNSRDPRTWTEEEVAEFVSSLPSCKDNAKLFVSHKIDGEAFLMLTQRDLVDILKFKLGPAIKLYNSIVLLRGNVNFYN